MDSEETGRANIPEFRQEEILGLSGTELRERTAGFKVWFSETGIHARGWHYYNGQGRSFGPFRSVVEARRDILGSGWAR